VEVANWFKEVYSGAQVYDFPALTSKKVLVDVLTHFAFIVGVVHHALNSGDPMGSKASLPFHLNALYAPLPTTKGAIKTEADLLPFLPPPHEAVHYIGFVSAHSMSRFLQQLESACSFAHLYLCRALLCVCLLSAGHVQPSLLRRHRAYPGRLVVD